MRRTSLGILPRLAAAGALFALAATPSSATSVEQAPLLPEVGAYRLTLFLGNLAPLPWADVEAAWSKPYRGSPFAAGALERIGKTSALDPAPLVRAIALKERQAVFSEATRLVAGRLEEALSAAISANGPGAAQSFVREARELFRAFENDLSATDPEASIRIKKAWLKLSTAAGAAGILGAGDKPIDPAAMAEARETISDYIRANYLVDDFAPRQSLSAVPESVALSGAAVKLPAQLPPGSEIRDQDPLPRLVLNFEEKGIDETDLALVAYGDMLFDSPVIFGGPARELGIACSTCHNRSDINQRLFIPGASHQPGAIDVDGAFFNPIFNDRRDDPLDIPSLRGLRFTGPYGRDGRFASLRDFTRNVIVNEFAGDEPTPLMLDAIVAYMLEFDFLPNSLATADGRLSDHAPDAAKRGEAIFNRPYAGMNGNSCATCHDPGSNFLDQRSHDIGSVASGYEGARDGALDTPTLLGAVYTAPYFHDGSLPTLAAVVDWFDETKSLDLSEVEKSDLTAYLETIGAADEPYEAFGGDNTAFRLAFDELTTFASTLDTLLPLRDTKHTLLLIDTVAADLSADAGTMENLAARSEIYALSSILADVGEAVKNDDWDAAEKSWAAFQAAATDVQARAY